MDFSVVLVVPFSALLAFATVLIAAIANRPRPRLIWPFAAAVLASIPVFVGPPGSSEFHFWALALFGLAIWAAIGTVTGGLTARLLLWSVRVLRSD